MKVLVISPTQPGIDVVNEVAWASQKNNVRLLSGIVTKREVESVLSAEQFDVVHFAQHGNRMALEMSDGMIAGDRIVRALEAQTSLKLVVMNACDSVGIASLIHNALGVPVIAHGMSITDRAASAFAEELYNALGNGRNIQQAFRESVSALGVLNMGEAASPVLINGSHHVSEDSFHEIISRMNEFDAKLDGLCTTVEELSKRLDYISTTPTIGVNSILLTLIMIIMCVTLYVNITGGL